MDLMDTNIRDIIRFRCRYIEMAKRREELNRVKSEEIGRFRFLLVSFTFTFSPYT